MIKVTFLKPALLGGKGYKAGTFQVQDRDVRSVEFKQLVKKGTASLAPRSDAEQKLQAHHDTFQSGLAHKAAKKNLTREERVQAAESQKKLDTAQVAASPDVLPAEEEAPSKKAKK